MIHAHEDMDDTGEWAQVPYPGALEAHGARP